MTCRPVPIIHARFKNWSSGFRASARYRVTDSIPPLRVKHGPMANKITTVSSAPLLAETIRRLHEDKPHSDLLVF